MRLSLKKKKVFYGSGLGVRLEKRSQDVWGMELLFPESSELYSVPFVRVLSIYSTQDGPVTSLLHVLSAAF